MPITGIICEFNPFHNGHLHLLEQVRAAMGGEIVCLMSGPYVQRGEPALLHKLDRAAAACACGADLVLELPITGAIASAEQFAAVGVQCLDALGCVDTLAFGSECGDAQLLCQTAALLQSDSFRDALRAQLDAKLPFAAARQTALAQLTGHGEILAQPNNILAVEYCKALRSTRVAPFTIPRMGDFHSDSSSAAPSASWLRAHDDAAHWTDRVPAEALARLRGAVRYGYTYGERAVLARLRTCSDTDWEALPYASEGLWRRVQAAARTGRTLDEVLETAATKRYPRARIRRMLLCAMLGISADDLAMQPPYLRILAFNDAGQRVLRRCKQTSRLPLIQPGETGCDLRYQALEDRASALYGLMASSLEAARFDLRNDRVVRL